MEYAAGRQRRWFWQENNSAESRTQKVESLRSFPRRFRAHPQTCAFLSLASRDFALPLTRSRDLQNFGP